MEEYKKHAIYRETKFCKCLGHLTCLPECVCLHNECLFACVMSTVTILEGATSKYESSNLAGFILSKEIF